MTETDYGGLRDAALEGDDEALRQLIDLITPVVHCRVARALRRRAHEARGRDLRTDLEDLVQDVFAALFDRGGRALRAWEPARGLTFLGFVGLLAEREVGMRMRTSKRNPWTEEPTASDKLGFAVGGTPSTEDRMMSRDLLERVLEDLRAWLTPEGRRYFQLLYVDGRSVAEVADTVGTTAPALYAWRSRLVKRVRKVRQELLEDRRGDQ